MTRTIWKRSMVQIIFENPRLTVTGAKNRIRTLEDLQYFYYEVLVLRNGATVFRATSHEFPKVNQLPVMIDRILGMEKSEMRTTEEGKGRKRTVRTGLVDTVEDGYGRDQEYAVTLERRETEIAKKGGEAETATEYRLSLAKTYWFYDKVTDCCKESHTERVDIEHLGREELLQLKEAAALFCELTIAEHNNAETDRNPEA